MEIIWFLILICMLNYVQLGSSVVIMYLNASSYWNTYIYDLHISLVLQHDINAIGLRYSQISISIWRFSIVCPSIELDVFGRLT